MAFKIKQEKTAPEIENARTKLEDALQFIVEKTDESPSTSEDEGNKLEITIKKEPSPVSSPTKRPAQRTQRKRRRKDEGLNKNSNSYIMKLFDRAVDLTPFNEQTPLYPICRAWINNQSLFNSNPTSQIKEESQNEENNFGEETDKGSEEGCSEEVRQLPPPKPFPPGRDLRIPSPMPRPDEPFTICSDEQNALSKEMLIGSHLERWKAVRQKWKQAAKANEDRYRESGNILKAIFEGTQSQTTTTSSEPWDPMTTVS